MDGFPDLLKGNLPFLFEKVTYHQWIIEAIENYFKLPNLKEVLAEYGQFNEPSQIYNVDESGMPQIIVHLMLW